MPGSGIEQIQIQIVCVPLFVALHLSPIDEDADGRDSFGLAFSPVANGLASCASWPRDYGTRIATPSTLYRTRTGEIAAQF